MDIRKKITKKSYILKSFLGLFSVFIIWSFLSYAEIIKPFFLPSPTEVIGATIQLFVEFGFLSDILISIYRIAVGFLLAIIIAVPLGILVGTIKSIEAFFEPIVAFIRYIPPSAFVPLSILWFGIGDLEKFFIIFIGVMPYMLILTADVVGNIKNEYIEVGRTFGATTVQIYTKIIIPSSLPGIWDAMRLMLGAAWTFIVLVEIIAATSGLGHVIVQSQRFLQTANVIAVIIIIGFLGLITDYLFKIGHKKFFPWSEK
ncbi:ABC transporter permease [Candidatus Falkowbacteria bacterium]|jgi:NitT/TauT family transport system permease protein|nr:ABC transporter permease [Candidatus Falkowbacteria bacterium]MBT4432790.1 ABC transporter permease [Candidatus Falkowbacteria bacterium]